MAVRMLMGLSTSLTSTASQLTPSVSMKMPCRPGMRRRASPAVIAATMFIFCVEPSRVHSQ